MRSVIWVALCASTAVHAGLIAFFPAAGGRDRAPSAGAPRAVISARLKNTLAPRKSLRQQSAHNGRARHASASARQPRVDNATRFYPPEAVAMGLQGETILMLRYGADGVLIDVSIAKSSGHAILDQAALRAARATPRVAEGPREMLFPVKFELQ